MLTMGPRGTKDILPKDVQNWRYIENVIRDTCRLFDYEEIRTPIFEHTELFLRGIGSTTDVVEKEMYTFTDRGDRSITLRPENTAAVVRSYLENKLYAETVPSKLFYIGPMFRYDRPQAGRYRQFHQFGVEAIGTQSPMIDAEVILLAVQILNKLGLQDLTLQLNSVGCPTCRKEYRDRLQAFLAEKKDGLCEDCKSRFDRNPMRILDCKHDKCQELTQGAPEIADCLCDECQTHFSAVQEILTAAGVPFILNPRLVRGLDYYTKTAFEIQYAPLGAQSAVCGGGRYDGLVEECGGNPTPGIGFAIGIERVLLALEKQNLLPSHDQSIDAFVMLLDKNAQAQVEGMKVVTALRQHGFSAEIDFAGRSLKAQMKQANRQNARYAILLGEDEIKNNTVMIKNMQTGEQKQGTIEDMLTSLKSED